LKWPRRLTVLSFFFPVVRLAIMGARVTAEAKVIEIQRSMKMSEAAKVGSARAAHFFGAKIALSRTFRRIKDSVWRGDRAANRARPGAAAVYEKSYENPRSQRAGTGLLVARIPFFVSKNFPQIDFDPLQRCRPVAMRYGPRVRSPAARFTTMVVALYDLHARRKLIRTR